MIILENEDKDTDQKFLIYLISSHRSNWTNEVKVVDTHKDSLEGQDFLTQLWVRIKDKTCKIDWSRTVKKDFWDNINQWKIYDTITKKPECKKRRQREAGEKKS